MATGGWVYEVKSLNQQHTVQRRNLVKGLVASLALDPIPAKMLLNSITNSLKATPTYNPQPESYSLCELHEP